MEPNDPPQVVWKDEGGKRTLVISGDWKLGIRPEIMGDEKAFWPDSFDTERLGTFDSTLPAYLLRTLREAEIEKPALEGLREDLRGLMELALKVPEREDAKFYDVDLHAITKLGMKSSKSWLSLTAFIEFTGETVLSILRFFTGRGGFRARDF